jgi:hypothetical protein
MSDMDQGLKRLLQASPAELLRFTVGDCEYLGPLPTEIAIEAQLVMDALFAARYQGEECGVNIEVQSSGDVTMPERCYNYARRAGFVLQRKIMSVVLWLRDDGTFPQSDIYEERVGDRLLGTWRIYSIYIFDLEARDIMQKGIVALLPLVPFMRGADLPTIEDAAKLVQHTAPPEQVAMLNTLLAVFTARFYGKEAAEALAWRLGMSEKIIEESPLYQAWITKAREEGEVKGEIKGRAEGEIKGRAEGEASGLVEAVRLVIENRFGALSQEMMTAIAGASRETLRAVLAHVATDSIDQVRERLGLPTGA